MGIALLVILVGCIIYTVFDVFKYIKPMTKEEYEDCYMDITNGVFCCW